MDPQRDPKRKMLDRIAEDNGVALVVLDEHSREVSVSNNNSICRALTTSSEFAPRCAEYCGVAFGKTVEGFDFEYRCHAGLVCKAVPVIEGEQRFVAIVGRTFTSADSYREATEKAISGEWRRFPANEFFGNVLLDSSNSKIDKAAEALSKFRAPRTPNILDLNAPLPEVKIARPAAKVVQIPKQPAHKVETKDFAAQKRDEEIRQRSNEASASRSLYERLLNMPYDTACRTVLEFLRSRFELKSVVWLENRDNRLEPAAAIGAFRDMPVRLGLNSMGVKLTQAYEKNISLVLRERAPEVHAGTRTLSLFPCVVAREVRGSIGVEGDLSEPVSNALVRLTHRIGSQLEFLRLKREAVSREWLNRATTRFTQSLKRIDADDFWTQVTQISAELVQSERASLLVRTKRSDDLRAKATVGARVDLAAVPNVGSRVARVVLERGKPVLVSDIGLTRIDAAPGEWRYKTGSFISYPIAIGDRKLGVMNFTDKAGGAVFGHHDLELLDAIAPQIAVAIDRTSFKEMAGELEQLSVTDALTGLLNRRYLEKRLSEEVLRSKRHRFPMSMMMLDVDAFKSYNDTFGHPAGDAALRIIADVLKDMLRGADVAARYGGEEFAILLPQTTVDEACVIAERLRQRIEHTEFPKRKVTVSIGIAACSNEIDTPDNIILAADHALYEAKNHGRNNVQIYDAPGKSFTEKIH